MRVSSALLRKARIEFGDVECSENIGITDFLNAASLILKGHIPRIVDRHFSRYLGIPVPRPSGWDLCGRTYSKLLFDFSIDTDVHFFQFSDDSKAR